MTDNTEDILYYDIGNNTVFLNDMSIAYTEKVSEDTVDEFKNCILPLATNGWRYHDTSNHRITWVQGVTAAVLAGIIAAVIPGTGKLAVLAKIGVTALGIVAGACAGESYGPYSSYQL